MQLRYWGGYVCFGALVAAISQKLGFGGDDDAAAAAAMAGGGHGASHNITHGGLSLHATKGWHSRVGQGMCAVMWFWVLYRAKQDGAVLMGWRHPWEAHGHGGHDEEAKHH